MSKATPIDLVTLAAGRYKLALDESATVDPSLTEKQWYRQIPCKHGFISVHSATELAGYCFARRLFQRLLALPGVHLHQRGDSELRVIFSPDRLDDVASTLKAKRKRRVSETERARLRLISPFAHTAPVVGAPCR